MIIRRCLHSQTSHAWRRYSSVCALHSYNRYQNQYLGGRRMVLYHHRQGAGAVGSRRHVVLYDSLSKSNRSVFDSDDMGDNEDSKGFAWYTCGPTVYDSAHLGHARTYVCLDIIHRLILHAHKDQRRRPIFIMNITDVDDKIIKRAAELDEEPLSLARRYEREFCRDMKLLNVMRPTVVARVSECVESDVVPYIERIIENGAAYVVTDDSNDTGYQSVYFDVQAFENMSDVVSWKYGKLAPSTAAVNGGQQFFNWTENDQSKALSSKGKKHPRDFVLWKAKKNTDTLFWSSPWGYGRPGWHIECSAMIESTMKRVSEMMNNTNAFDFHARSHALCYYFCLILLTSTLVYMQNSFRRIRCKFMQVE